jgi:O-methyltransferase
MKHMLAEMLTKRYPIITDQVDREKLRIILEELERTLNDCTVGDIVEFGCYEGTTSLFIKRLQNELNDSRHFHVFDSFAGLPEKTVHDNSPAGDQFKPGELTASKQQFITNFKKARLPLPIIHKAWFNDLRPGEIPNAIAFAFLDGDYYESIRVSLKLIEPRLVRGAVVIVDDYYSNALPGTKKAVDEWLQNKDYALKVAHSLAVISTPRYKVC